MTVEVRLLSSYTPWNTGCLGGVEIQKCSKEDTMHTIWNTRLRVSLLAVVWNRIDSGYQIASG